MRYLCLLYVVEETAPAPGTPEFDEVRGANVAATGAMAEARVLVDSAPLHPVRSATTLRVREGETLHRRTVRRAQGAARRLLPPGVRRSR